MKALSLWQPWAQLMAIQRKKIETRSWPPWPRVIGQRFALHATAKQSFPSHHAPHDQQLLELALGNFWWRRIPYGAIVATATLIEARQVNIDQTNLPQQAIILPNTRQIETIERRFGDYSPGRWLWIFDDITAEDPPIPAKGKQGIRDWEPPAGSQWHGY